MHKHHRILTRWTCVVFSEALTRHLAVEWGKDGVRTVCVAPGATRDTEGMRRLGENIYLYI